MKKQILFAVLFLSVFAAANLHASGGPMAFMKNGAGARSLGFGNAATGTGGDNDSVIFNSAGLVLIPDLQFSFETYIMSFGRIMNYISISKPFMIGENKFASAFSWTGYSPGQGLELRKTDTPEPEGSFNDSSNVFVLSGATTISKNLFAGVNIKLFLQSLYTARAAGVGFDAGLLLKPLKDFGIGINITDIASSIGWSNNPDPEKIPLCFNAGISYVFFSSSDSYIMPSADFCMDADGDFEIRGGLETFLFDSLYLRAGYDKAFCFGAGIFLKPSRVFTVKLNYSVKFDVMLPGDTNHRIGMVFDYIFPYKPEKTDKTLKNTREGRKEIDEW